MINLLPPQTKQAYRYAERNVKLVNWVLAFVVGLVGLGVIGTYGMLSLHSNINNYDAQVSAIEATLQKQHLAQTTAEVKDTTNSFKLVLRVLSQEVLFSQLLKQLAIVMPSGANLTNLNIAKIQGGIDIMAEAKDYATATQVQVNLADPNNKIFAKADIVNIICDAKTAKDPRYPCNVTVRALFGPNNPFLFINQKASP